MLKKYCLALFLLFYSINCSANIFDDILDGICNIGQADITETWSKWDSISGKMIPDPELNKETFKSNGACPPWNKNSGRKGTCLEQFSFPGRFIGFYLQSCAQDTKENKFFEPRVAINTQTCNVGLCFSKSTTLKWDGECLVWPGAYGLPILRICARIANPAKQPTLGDNSNLAEIPKDKGYTDGWHLNLKGESEPDKNPTGYDGKEIKMKRPKLCAYSDPGLVNLISDTGVHTDALDWNPVSQPLHYTTKTHWLAEILKFLVTYNEQALDSISQLLGVLGNGDSVKVLQSILGAVGKIMEAFHTPAVLLINAFGSLNSAVDDLEMGCVEIPLGPYPPPFCNPLSTFKPTPTTERICGNDENGNIIASLLNNRCVVAEDSGTVNNFINNSIRISIDNLIVLCNDKDDATKTDKCVKISGGPFLPSTMHGLSHNDIIRSCASNGGVSPCVENAIPKGCSGPSCIEKFRLVYMPVLTSSPNAASTSNNKPTKEPTASPSNYFASDLVNCDGTKNTCQIIWGVNAGEFRDISLRFKEIDDNNNLEATTKVGDKDFKVSIVRKTPETKDDEYPQNPQDICVFDVTGGNNSLVGCEKRDPLTKVNLYTCNDPEADGLPCDNNIVTNYFAPQVVASIKSKDGKYSTKTLIKALTVQNPFDGGYKANLAGYDLSSFVAYIPIESSGERLFKPFDINNPQSITPLSIYGTYKGLSKLEDLTPNQNTLEGHYTETYFNEFINSDKGYRITDPKKTKYSRGLEYLNDRYIRGGTHICLTPDDMEHCPLNEQNCVLTRLKNPIVNCVAFRNKQAAMPKLRLCNGQDTIPKDASFEAFENITIHTFSDTTCYKNNSDPQEEVCAVTTDLLDRIDPSPDKGIILDKTLYYHTNINTSSQVKDHSIEVQNATVDCKAFGSKVAGLKDFKLCPNNQSLNDSCTSEEMPGIGGGPGITIKKCDTINCYVNHANPLKEVCVIQSANHQTAYNPLKQTTRDKTPEELGLCKPIPQPTCSAIYIFTPEDGNAVWPKTTVGEISTGTCRPGWSLIDPSKPLERYCVANALDKSIVFEKLDDNVGCEPAKIDFGFVHTFGIGMPLSQYDGTFTFGVDPDINYHSVSDGNYYSKIYFNISNKDSLEYFRLSSISYDDYVRVIVNSNYYIFERPQDVVDEYSWNFDNFPVYRRYSDGGRYFVEKDVNLDLIPYLTNGYNEILVKLIVVGGGGLYYRIDYKFK